MLYVFHFYELLVNQPKVMVIPIVVGALEMVWKRLDKRLRELEIKGKKNQDHPDYSTVKIS